MLPSYTVDIIGTGSGGRVLREVLESYFVRVDYYTIGEAKDVVELFGGKRQLSKYVVLECHGDGRGMLIPELDAALEAKQPYHKAISAANFKEFLRLRPRTLVVNTGCSLGTAEFAKAFLQGGCQAYIGATDDPDASAARFFVYHFFYELLCNRRSIKAAHQRAASHDKETRLFKLYERKGRLN
jgi:hypothetical protein